MIAERKTTWSEQLELEWKEYFYWHLFNILIHNRFYCIQWHIVL